MLSMSLKTFFVTVFIVCTPLSKMVYLRYSKW
nr:MAG TPA: hypothetical protein [Caudoviricetes sp.]